MRNYEKDETNFHEFIAITRKDRKAKLDTLCQGVCSLTMMNYIESGERLPDKLTRDRLLSRLGVWWDGYENYLSAEEYEDWLLRQKILECIEEKNVDEAYGYLKKYQEKNDLNMIAKQFVETMNFMLLQLSNASLEEQIASIEKAVSFTVAEQNGFLLENSLLSIQEINLILHYLVLEQNEKTECMLQKLLKYVEQMKMDDLSRTKIYSKVAYYYARQISVDKDINKLQDALAVCDKAIEILRDNKKMYYLIELLEIYQIIAKRILQLKRTKNLEALKEAIEIKQKWELLLKGLYQEYQVEPYMENFCYLYEETECYRISDVVRIRRKMLGMTRKELCEGICSIKTLSRLENGKYKTHMALVRELFERIGLCAEYTRARIITTNAQTLNMVEELANISNGEQYKEWGETLFKLETILEMNIPQNRQAIERNYLLYQLKKKLINKEEFVEQLVKILEYTVPSKALFDSKELFLSSEEKDCISSIATRNPVSDNKYMQVISNICEQYEKEGLRIHTKWYEFLADGLYSYFGNLGMYTKSNEISEKLMKICLINRRANMIDKNIYNKLWNSWQQNMDESEIKSKENLERCIEMCELMKKENYRQFYKKKLTDIIIVD